MISIPIPRILVQDRQRLDHSNTDGLKESLAEFGTIQPLVLEELKGDPEHNYRLIAGGRRLAFLRELGHTTLFHASVYDPKRPGFVFGTELTADQLHELEIEENIRRKAMTWQERCLGIANLHRLKVARLGATDWGQKETGELFGMSAAKVTYVMRLARELQKKDSPVWSMDQQNDALRWLAKCEEDLAMAELARRQPAVEVVEPTLSLNLPTPDEKESARERYLSNPHNDPLAFEEYWQSRQAVAATVRVNLSARLHLGNCLAYMDEHPSTFNHIITDPPYGISMENLHQDGVKMALIDTVQDTHKVFENEQLFRDFFFRAFTSLKDMGFLAVWCDISQWHLLTSLAKRAGFRVQGWPIVWVKTHVCMNSCANQNFTKTTELVLVCRKGNATLIRPAPLGHIIAGHDELRDQLSHPFVKPFAVWEHIVSAVSIEGESVLDPFAGAGSGVLSFARLRRNFFGCEIDPTHYNHLLETLRQHYLALNPNTTFS